jgi:hypothetical protein
VVAFLTNSVSADKLACFTSKGEKLKFLYSLLISTALGSSIGYGKDIHCAVQLLFNSDKSGAAVQYELRLQLKNTTGRNVSGASIVYKDREKNVLGNALLSCGVPEVRYVTPGSFGECFRTLQQVDSSYVDMLGADKWTQIVNNQLANMDAIKFCQVLGFEY